MKVLKRILAFWLGISCQYTHLYAQHPIEHELFSINAIVFDSLNKEVIPFAKVYNVSEKMGTSTMSNGSFVLSNVSAGDSILFYSFGFVKKIIAAENVRYSDTVFLSPAVHVLSNILVLADNSFLYDIIHKAKKNRTVIETVAKSYLELSSYSDEDQLELIQGYYNAYYNGYDLTQLKTVNVRFGIRPKWQTFYSSISAAKVFLKHQLFEKNTLFPSNPFSLSYGELKNKYILTLHSKLKQNGKTSYVIGFEPFNKKEDLFSGAVWIDSAECSVQKIILEKKNATSYPFAPILDNVILSNVDLKITKAFSCKNDTTRVNYIDFEYSYSYKNKFAFNIKTHVTLQSYDYTSIFVEPFFNFPKERELSHELNELYIIGYDKLFWDCMDEYKPSSNTYRNNLFYADSLTKFYYDAWPAKGNIYVTWGNMKRFILRASQQVDTLSHRAAMSTIPSQNYYLCVQIYLSINNMCDTVHYTTKTIFDPFQSYFYYPITVEVNIFVNIYFDIIEIQRRKLNEKLDLCYGDVQKMKNEYDEILKETAQISNSYFNEVNRGKNGVALQHWNNYVKERLGIDNLTLFHDAMQQN